MSRTWTTNSTTNRTLLAPTPSMNFARRLSEQKNRLQNNAEQVLRRLPVVLSENQIERLKQHRYASEGTTLLDPYMQLFWKWLVEFFPLWVAPNLITIVGLTINIATSILLMILTDGAKEQCPRWMYFLTGFGLFLYQTLDAIDGKQARRTGSSTPLGELFDHGCDSVSTVFVTLACCCAVQLGHYPWLMFWCCMFSYLAFYCAHWQTYVSGKLRFAKLDCTEAQFSFIITNLISVVAPNVWGYRMPIIQIEYRVFAALLMLSSTVWSSMNNLHTISKGGIGRHKSTVADTSIIFPVWPIGFLIFLAFIGANHQLSRGLIEHPALQLVCYGIAFSKVTNRLIIAHMSKSELNTWDTAYIAPLALCINQYFNFWLGEHLFLWFFLIFSVYDLLQYNVKVCQELCDALNIHCFRISPAQVVTPSNAHSH